MLNRLENKQLHIVQRTVEALTLCFLRCHSLQSEDQWRCVMELSRDYDFAGWTSGKNSNDTSGMLTEGNNEGVTSPSTITRERRFSQEKSTRVSDAYLEVGSTILTQQFDTRFIIFTILDVVDVKLFGLERQALSPNGSSLLSYPSDETMTDIFRTIGITFEIFEKQAREEGKHDAFGYRGDFVERYFLWKLCISSMFKKRIDSLLRKDSGTSSTYCRISPR